MIDTQSTDTLKDEQWNGKLNIHVQFPFLKYIGKDIQIYNSLIL